MIDYLNKTPSVHKHIRCIPNKYVLTTGTGEVINKNNGKSLIMVC